MRTKEDFDLLAKSPETESEVVEKPFLGDKRMVKKHLDLHFPLMNWNSRGVQTMIQHWKEGGIVLRCRHPRVSDGAWQCLSVEKLDGGLPASAN